MRFSSAYSVLCLAVFTVSVSFLRGTVHVVLSAPFVSNSLCGTK